MFEFWYDYVKPKYGIKAKLCYMDTDSFIVYIKTLYLERYCRRCWSKILHSKLWIRMQFHWSLSKEKNKKVIGLMKDELDGKIRNKFTGIKAKAYSYLINGGNKE